MPLLVRSTWTWLGTTMLAITLTACGGDSGDAAPNGKPQPTQSGTVSVLAGQLGGNGSLDGVGPAARFSLSAGITSDHEGNVFVADAGNHTIRKITPAGKVTTLAGAAELSGAANGLGTVARFNSPQGIAVDNNGNILIADTGNHTIRKITSTGIVTTIAGTPGAPGSADGTGANSQFNGPTGITRDRLGNLFVADSGNHTIRKITPAGIVSTFAGASGLYGTEDGTGADARLNSPIKIAIGLNDCLLVTTNGAMRKITPAGEVTTFGNTGWGSMDVDGNLSEASFFLPTGISTDRNGNIFVAATTQTIRKISSSGIVTTLAGASLRPGYIDGKGTEARFSFPFDLSADLTGNIFVADTLNHTIRKITATGVVTTLAGKVSIKGSTDGMGSEALFSYPDGIARDRHGNLFVADPGNYTIRKITPAGIVSTFAGAAGMYGTEDGTGADARFGSVAAIAIDTLDNLFVSDGNAIRMISPAGQVSTLAGATDPYGAGSSDGTGADAQFNSPDALAVDTNGNVFVADTGNFTIRKITPDGVVTTLAGAAEQEGSVDGRGSVARFRYPRSLVIDSTGNIVVADGSTIRKITPTGDVSTIAGSDLAKGTTNGTGIAARFNYPSALAADSAGNVFVADNTIRKIAPDGAVTTVAGIPGRSGVVPGPLPTSLNHMSGMTIGLNGEFYVTAEAAVIKVVID